MKKTILLFFIAVNAICQIPVKREFQEGNTTQLVQFEKGLPPKIYDFSTSDLQVKWHILILDLIEQTYGYTPNVAARSLAYINLAAYEAILPAYPKMKSLTGQIQDYERPKELKIDSNEFMPQLAMNTAIFTVVDKMFLAAPYIWMEKVQALKDSVNNIYARKSSIYAIMKSKMYGQNTADWVLTYAEKDGGSESMVRSYDLNYRLPNCESCFEINRVADLENTGPLHPNWGNNRTFFKNNVGDFDIKPSFEYSKYKDSKFYKDALEVLETSKKVTAGSEMHQIANFWDDAATYTYTAVGHSLSILTQVLRAKPESLEKGAKTYVQLSLALNDAMIATWKIKYKYNILRPNAFIKKYIDSKWEPTLLTPPFPEFPSGHSTQSSTMATILTQAIGDSVAFTDYSKYWVGDPRKFKSFWAAANETSISRLYGGIHFREALTKGQELGKIIGKNALMLQFE